MKPEVHVIGAGLAGAECAHQLARRGFSVILWEMRPQQKTPAHKTGDLAELVCSNSLRSDDPGHAAGLLKREMEVFGSLVIAAARKAAVPAGSALAVDRDLFAGLVTSTIEANENIELRRLEANEIPDGKVVIATGPLTSPVMADLLERLLGSQYLYFYDAIAPVVDADSLDLDKMFRASRYDKGDGDDYLNAPFDEPGYLAFHQALVDAPVSDLRDFEKRLFFEGCLPVEELARRGVNTLCFGPMKPVGLRTPDGTRPHAVVQLRQENLARTHYNLVGFQSRIRWGDQERVFRMIPGLEQARFIRLGQIHRNTFVNSPRHLDKAYRVRSQPRIRLAGQITGVEGYLESAATGLLCALYLSLEHRMGTLQDTTPEGEPAIEPLPSTTGLGALARHLTESDPDRFQPANINYGLFDPLAGRVKKRFRRQAYTERAHMELGKWIERVGIPTLAELPLEAEATVQAS